MTSTILTATAARERVAAALLEEARHALAMFLGGDNAATWHALGAFAGEQLDQFGLITLDAHLDMRDGRSNGSPVRQLLDEGLDAHHVVQVGLGDFSNSAAYARAPVDARRARSLIATRFIARTRRVIARARSRRRGSRAADRSTSTSTSTSPTAPSCRAVRRRRPGGLSADEVRRFVREARVVQAASSRSTSPKSTSTKTRRPAHGAPRGAVGTRGARGRAKESAVTVTVGVEPLTRAQLVAVARGFEPVALSDEVLAATRRASASAIDALVDSGEPIYGLSTGFGSLATTSSRPRSDATCSDRSSAATPRAWDLRSRPKSCAR